MEYDGDNSWPITRLDHMHIERWYAARGLEIYMQGSERNASRAVRLYRELPTKLRVLDLDSQFSTNPFEVLLHHQILAEEV